MDVLNPSDALQSRPVPKPQNSITCILKVVPQLASKCALNKLIYLGRTSFCQRAVLRMHLDGRLQPHADVRYPLRKTIRPVVAEDLVVFGMRKGNGIAVCK